jgi:hypothetical protein
MEPGLEGMCSYYIMIHRHDMVAILGPRARVRYQYYTLCEKRVATTPDPSPMPAPLRKHVARGVAELALYYTVLIALLSCI